MPIINDAEFGEIVIRSHHNASRISLRVAPDGRLRASIPPLTPTVAIKLLIKTSRGRIRQLLAERNDSRKYISDQTIGKSHTLVIQNSTDSTVTSVQIVGTKIIVRLCQSDDILAPIIQNQIRQSVLKALRKEAKSYLPRRLDFLAKKYGFSYQNVKLTHASSRWGSCSSHGTISMNISLMQLPFELLDYVLVHELCHTRQMNHSENFWLEVAKITPNYKKLRQQLKKFTPNI